MRNLSATKLNSPLKEQGFCHQSAHIDLLGMFVYLSCLCVHLFAENIQFMVGSKQFVQVLSLSLSFKGLGRRTQLQHFLEFPHYTMLALLFTKCKLKAENKRYCHLTKKVAVLVHDLMHIHIQHMPPHCIVSPTYHQLLTKA